MDLRAEAQLRLKWPPKQREEYSFDMMRESNVGDSVVVVFLDGPLGSIRRGDEGVIVSMTKSEVNCTFEKHKRFRSKRNPATLMWYELIHAERVVLNPMEQHLRKMVAG